MVKLNWNRDVCSIQSFIQDLTGFGVTHQVGFPHKHLVTHWTGEHVICSMFFLLVSVEGGFLFEWLFTIITVKSRKEYRVGIFQVLFQISLQSEGFPTLSTAVPSWLLCRMYLFNMTLQVFLSRELLITMNARMMFLGLFLKWVILRDLVHLLHVSSKVISWNWLLTPFTLNLWSWLWLAQLTPSMLQVFLELCEPFPTFVTHKGFPVNL